VLPFGTVSWSPMKRGRAPGNRAIARSLLLV
jgi:hypothetical protein